MGRLVEKKGVHILLQAINELRKNQDRFTLQIFGEGPEKTKLISLVQEKQLEEYVSFLGEMPNSEVSSWLQNLDCFILPCVKDSNGDMDGIPVSLMEAMLMGVPVISTNISGVPELIIQNETGLIAQTESSSDLTKKMFQIITCNAATTNKLVSNAISHIHVNFDNNRNATKLSNLINE